MTTAVRGTNPYMNVGDYISTIKRQIINENQEIPLIQKALDITFKTLEFGWDIENGGIFYFKDVKGHPPQQLEWDQKLWWVHVEALVALAKGYVLTKDIRCVEWFQKIHEYTWSHFKDPHYGEWFGYLQRDGVLTQPAKGNLFKGAFHVPRQEWYCWQLLKNRK